MSSVALSHWKIVTGARLHFGLLDTRSPFGGAGMMIDGPRTVVTFEAGYSLSLNLAEDLPASEQQDLRDRVEAVAARFQRHFARTETPRVRITIQERPAPHSGLGSGTQLAMAIAEGLCLSEGIHSSIGDVAVEVAGRGQRSAVGVHGYHRGGFIFEAKTSGTSTLNPMLANELVPDDWRIVLTRDRQEVARVAGGDETSRFARVPRPTAPIRGGARMILENQLLPALRDASFKRFADAVFQYNLVSGGFFAKAQGGAYNGEANGRLVRFLRDQGAIGVGQSSWGPTIFAFCESPAEAAQLVDVIPQDRYDTRVVRPLNQPRALQQF